MNQKAFQDYYPDDFAQCYGCGRLNEHGHQIKSYWDGDETIAVYTPRPEHMAIPGYVYGGLIASLIDCHSTGTASAAASRREGREMDTLPPMRDRRDQGSESGCQQHPVRQRRGVCKGESGRRADARTPGRQRQT